MITCTLPPDSTPTAMSHLVYDALHAAGQDNTAAECAAALFFAHDAAAGVALVLAMAPDLKLVWEEPPC